MMYELYALSLSIKKVNSISYLRYGMSRTHHGYRRLQ